MKKRVFVATLIGIALLLPGVSFGATKLSYGVWIPYWKKTAAIPETIQNIDTLSVISPFSYEVQTNGTVRDAMKLRDVSWLTLMETAGSKSIKVVPTFSWQNGDAIHSVLASSTKRQAHESSLLKIVDENDFDGVDIDYENKKAETSVYFSKFLSELSPLLHARKKTLSCTIEPRTPPSSRFVTVPKKLEYANDFTAINKYCDEVRIMAYGQGRIDLKLNKTKGANGAFYAPIGDTDWTEKVIQETLKSINKNKVVLAVANFGYEYEVSKTDAGTVYKNLRSLSYTGMNALASSTGSRVERNKGGELGFAYTSSTPGSTIRSTRYVTLSDTESIAAKVALAKKYKLKGVFVFRIDGESEPSLWTALK